LLFSDNLAFVIRCGVGPALGFAHNLRSLGAMPRPIGLVPCAVGGSSLDDWGGRASLQSTDPENGAAAKPLSKAAVNRAEAALAAAGPKSTLRAVLWYQGETDAMDEDLANSYAVRDACILHLFISCIMITLSSFCVYLIHLRS